MKVLIVDDSTMIRLILKGILKQLGIEDVVEASDGLQALEFMGKIRVNMILLDIHMPKMDGVGLLTRLQEMPAEDRPPVIIISSDSNTDQVEKVQELGARAFIRKPFKAEGLREAMNAVGVGSSAT